MAGAATGPGGVRAEPEGDRRQGPLRATSPSACGSGGERDLTGCGVPVAASPGRGPESESGQQNGPHPRGCGPFSMRS